ncbi:MAG: MFS transporter [Planctomycetes bacterium]|nr:MFS transporter [Planctomycetota bacterium]
MPRSNRSAMMIVFLVVFIDLLGFGIVLPILAVIADSYVKRVVPYDAGTMVGLIIGLLMSCFSLMQFLFAPIWGRWSDRIGRRPILLVGLLGSVVFYSLFGYAASLAPETSAGLALGLFFVARIGAGVAGATIATAQAVIADCTAPEKRKHGMALIGVAFGIGFTFGPLIGFGCLWIRDLYPAVGLGIIGYTAAGMSLIALLLGIGLFKETLASATQVGVDEPGIKEGMPAYRAAPDPLLRRNWFDWSATRQALVDPAIAPVILTFFIASLGFGAFEVTLALFLKDVFGFGAEGNFRDTFLIFAYIGFILMLTQGVLYRRLAARVSEATFMAMGLLFMALGVAMQGGICYAWWNSYDPASLQPYLYIALTAAVVGFAFLTPSAQALVSRRTAADRQGEILGVNQSASALARILGPVLGVTLYKSTDSHLLGAWRHAL